MSHVPGCTLRHSDRQIRRDRRTARAHRRSHVHDERSARAHGWRGRRGSAAGSRLCDRQMLPDRSHARGRQRRDGYPGWLCDLSRPAQRSRACVFGRADRHHGRRREHSMVIQANSQDFIFDHSSFRNGLNISNIGAMRRCNSVYVAGARLPASLWQDGCDLTAYNSFFCHH